MMTLSLLLFFLASFGLAFVLGHSKITLPFRTWLGGAPDGNPRPAVPGLGPWIVMLLECPACLGFHFGWAVVVWGPPLGVPFTFWWAVAVMSCATSAVNLLLAKHVGML